MPEITVSELSNKVEGLLGSWEQTKKDWDSIAEERGTQIEEVGASTEELKTKQAEIENRAKALEDKIEKGIEELSGRLSEMGEHGKRLDEIDKRIGRSNNRGPNGQEAKTPGQLFTESSAVKEFHDALQSGDKVKTPDVSVESFRRSIGAPSRMAADNFLSDATATFIEPWRPDLLMQVERRFFFRDLVGSVRVGIPTNSVTHIRELGFRSDADVLTVSGITRTGQVATATTSTDHNLVEGNLFEIAGADQAEYNGVWVVETKTATTVTFTVTGSPTTPATGTMTLTRLVASGAAAGTAEGSAMPQASTRWEEEAVAIRLIGHWIAVSQILLDDLPQMADFIDRRLVYGIEFEIEEQGLYGTGSGQQFQGLFTHPRRLQLTKGADLLPDAILRAMAHSFQAEYEPNVVWMHPLDWKDLLSTKDTNNAYQFLRLGEAAPRAIDGTRVVVANSVKKDDLGVVDLQKVGTLYDRQRPSISMTNSHDAHFPANMLAIKAFERLGFGVHYGPAFVHMDLSV